MRNMEQVVRYRCKLCGKYQIKHTDGTPLNGEKYFVLRLDSPDPVESARVEAAMAAYKGNSNTVNLEDAKGIIGALKRIIVLIKGHEYEDANMGISDCSSCLLDAKDTAKAWIMKLGGKACERNNI